MRRQKKDRDWSGGVTCEVKWEVGGVKKRAIYGSMRKALQKRNEMSMEQGLEVKVIRLDTGDVVVSGRDSAHWITSEKFWDGFFGMISRNAV